MAAPRPGGPGHVTDGGLETDLIYRHGIGLPEFAAFPLVEDDAGRAVLRDYYAGYAEIARSAGAAFLLAAPTWRANPDWGARVGYDAAALARANGAAIALLHELREQWPDLDVTVSGMVGPRHDGYVAGERPDVAEAADYHRPQLAAFAEAGAELAEALTMTTAAEASGIVRAATEVGIPVAVMFTVETDGRLPDGTSLKSAVRQVDEAGEVAYLGVNCAHPQHVARGLADADWVGRLAELRPNASDRSHEELDAMDDLDRGDVAGLAADVEALRGRLPALAVVGGCCGTDDEHVAALWATPATG